MNTFLEKEKQIKKLFKSCRTPEARYQKIIELGKSLPSMPSELKIEENKVHGCQSIVYLHSEMHKKKIYYAAFSEALISSGLAMLLLKVYNEESPETVIKCKPSFLEELGIPASLSPGRSNGLASMYLRMQQEALKFLLPR